MPRRNDELLLRAEPLTAAGCDDEGPAHLPYRLQSVYR